VSFAIGNKHLPTTQEKVQKPLGRSMIYRSLFWGDQCWLAGPLGPLKARKYLTYFALDSDGFVALTKRKKKL
jgi:hypothetical protein